MLYEVCFEGRNGDIYSVAVEGKDKKEARMAALSMRGVLGRASSPILFISRIYEDDYMNINDDFQYDSMLCDEME